MISIPVSVPILFLIAAYWALKGTGMQAAQARGRWAADPSNTVANAVRVWRPGPRWVWRKKYRLAYMAIEEALATDPPARARLRALEYELKSWNYLESSVAAAVVASVLSAIPTVIDLFH